MNMHLIGFLSLGTDLSLQLSRHAESPLASRRGPAQLARARDMSQDLYERDSNDRYRTDVGSPTFTSCIETHNFTKLLWFRMPAVDSRRLLDSWTNTTAAKCLHDSLGCFRIRIQQTLQAAPGPMGTTEPSVCEKTFLRRRRHVNELASKIPNRGLESSFCCWTAGQGLARKELLFHRHRYVQNYSASSVNMLLLRPRILKNSHWRFKWKTVIRCQYKTHNIK